MTNIKDKSGKAKIDNFITTDNQKIERAAKITNVKTFNITQNPIILILLVSSVSFLVSWLSYNRILGKNTVDNSTKAVALDSTNSDMNTVDIVENSMDAMVSIVVDKKSDEDKLVASSSNTGFIIDSEGLILTNNYVVSSYDEDYIVITADGEEYEVIDIQRDNVNGIVVLKVKLSANEKLKALELGDSSKLQVGQNVIAIGTPFGEYAGIVTTGVVSGLNRTVITDAGTIFGVTLMTLENVIQTDTFVKSNSGNSGGPLLDDKGLVIGVNYATSYTNNEDFSITIPINFVKDRLNEYKKYGKFRNPSLGLAYEIISEYQAKLDGDLVAGSLILNVEKGGPADKAGIKEKDIITKINGDIFGGSLSEAILNYEVDELVKITVWREGEFISIDVVLGEAENL